MSSGRGLPGHRTSKKLIMGVRPGVELVRASFAPTSALITLDLPTLERPRKAISGRLGAGKCDTSVAAARNRARILMSQCAMSRRDWQARKRTSRNNGGAKQRRPEDSPRASPVYPFSEPLRDETACSE